jgi:hypothetical protein
MCSRVQAAIKEGQQPGAGSVRQALCGALYEQVTDFYRLVAVLESQLAVPIPAPGKLAVGADWVGTTAAADAGLPCRQRRQSQDSIWHPAQWTHRVKVSVPETASLNPDGTPGNL